MSTDYSEDTLVEQPAIALFSQPGYDTANCQAESGAHLKQLLGEDHRFIFTLIQKFGTKPGEKYPMLSDRSDIIVMTDEAHRSQYDTLALNMRNALPNAAFIGFTGTPLMAGEEKTKEVFGDYVSIYNFQQSIEDEFCLERGVDLQKVIDASPEKFQKVWEETNAAYLLVDANVREAVDDAVEELIINDELKKKFISLANQVIRLYKAILPDASANAFAPIKTCLAVLADKIRTFTEEANIDDIIDQVGELLDESIATKGYVIHATEETSLLDLSQVDFDALKSHFDKGRKRTEAEKLKRAVGDKLTRMVTLNKTRTDLLEKFKKLIDEYNKGLDVDSFFAKLTDFVKELSAEQQRGVSEQLSDEELTLFDILTKPEFDITAGEKKQVKKVARMLLQTLKEAKLVLDWRKRQRTRADVYTTVKTILDELPRAYTPELYQQKCDTVYQHVYDSYQGEGRSIYATSG